MKRELQAEHSERQILLSARSSSFLNIIRANWIKFTLKYLTWICEYLVECLESERRTFYYDS
jgi:hypothetical protein